MIVGSRELVSSVLDRATKAVSNLGIVRFERAGGVIIVKVQNSESGNNRRLVEGSSPLAASIMIHNHNYCSEKACSAKLRRCGASWLGPFQSAA
jgi:hypothetical protein